MSNSTIKQQPERRMTGTISCACPGDAYRALSEHAYLRRQSLGSLVRETLEGAGLFTMPGAEDPLLGHSLNSDGLVDVLAD